MFYSRMLVVKSQTICEGLKWKVIFHRFWWDGLINQQTKIQLRNRKKIKVRVLYTILHEVQNSPVYRGVKLWERLFIKLLLS